MKRRRVIYDSSDDDEKTYRVKTPWEEYTEARDAWYDVAVALRDEQAEIEKRLDLPLPARMANTAESLEQQNARAETYLDETDALLTRLDAFITSFIVQVQTKIHHRIDPYEQTIEWLRRPGWFSSLDVLGLHIVDILRSKCFGVMALHPDEHASAYAKQIKRVCTLQNRAKVVNAAKRKIFGKLRVL